MSELKQSADRLRHGLDFGYAADPAAAIRLHVDISRGRIYVLGELRRRA